MLVRRLLRGLGWLLAALLAVVLLATGGVWVNAQRIMTQRHTNPVANITVAGTPEQIERGAYLVSAMPGCAGCHASDPLPARPILDGKRDDDLAALATLYVPNLTPGGRLRDWSDGEVVRAIREGIDRDGRALLLMPSDQYRHLSDADAHAIVAYLRSQPAVANDTPPPSLTLLGTALVGTGVFHLSNQPPVSNVVAPPRAATVEYGGYIAQTSGCAACHGPALDGADIPPGPPPGPSLRLVKGWTEEQFIRTLRDGVNPAGHRLSDEMPWREYGRGSDDDLRALYRYLRSLP